MLEGEIAFNLFYVLILFGLIYPPQEFCSAGQTLNHCRHKIDIKYLNFRVHNWEPFFELFRLRVSSVRAISHQPVMPGTPHSLCNSSRLLLDLLLILRQHELRTTHHSSRFLDVSDDVGCGAAVCCDVIDLLLQTQQLGESPDSADSEEILQLSRSELDDCCFGHQQWVPTEREARETIQLHHQDCCDGELDNQDIALLRSLRSSIGFRFDRWQERFTSHVNPGFNGLGSVR